MIRSKDITRLSQKFGLNCEEKQALSLTKGHLNLSNAEKLIPFVFGGQIRR